MAILAPHISRSQEIIKSFLVSFITEDRKSQVFREIPIGSGTFVNTCGLEGILTAYHVAKDLDDLSEYCICMSEKPERQEIHADDFKHVPIGILPDGAKVEDGPDLSFLIC